MVQNTVDLENLHIIHLQRPQYSISYLPTANQQQFRNRTNHLPLYLGILILTATQVTIIHWVVKLQIDPQHQDLLLKRYLQPTTNLY